MSTTIAQLDLWRAAPSEHQRLEFKEAKNQFAKEKVYEYCVALANEGGGHLVLGVADEKPRRVVSTHAFENLTHMAEQIFTTVGFRVDVEEVTHPDGRVVVFTIPPRPRGTAYHLGGRYLMRAGGSLVPMSEDQLRRIFADGAPDWLEEPTRTGLTEEKVTELLDMQTYFELIKRPFPSSRAGIIDRLTQERFIERNVDGYSVSRLGAILLARQLDDFPDLRRKAPRVVVYSGKSKLETRLDQAGGKGYAVGFQSLVRFVMSQLPQNEIVADALRSEMTIAPEIVVRELVANALVHQDFSVTGASTMIEVYTDRLEISNPGEPIVPVDRFIDGYQSRNEHLADCMRRQGICEEKSSGIDKVISAAELYQLPAPDFRVVHNRTNVVIRGPMQFSDMGKDDRIRACFQHCALRWVMAESMTNQSLRARFGLPENRATSVSQIIAMTIEAGLIKADESVGASRKLARYLPVWA
jgi:ATP-dependent DNA helicase RecG